MARWFDTSGVRQWYWYSSVKLVPRRLKGICFYSVIVIGVGRWAVSKVRLAGT